MAQYSFPPQSTSPQEWLQQQVQGKRVLVLGLGLQGGAQVANCLAKLGGIVRVTDKKTAEQLTASVDQLENGIELALGREEATDVQWAELIIKNPAVPFTHPLVVLAQQQGVPVTSEAALALQAIRDRTIGVTGTRGKTTTTTLIGHILQQAGQKVLVGGNIPNHPTILTALEAPTDAWIVLELSSFQLETTDQARISPAIGVLTSFSPDHLNRYGTLDEYFQAKAHLFRWQKPGDIAVWWQQPEWEAKLAAVMRDRGELIKVTKQDANEIYNWAPSPLPGEHNQNNVALAVRVAEIVGISHEVISRAVASFYGVAYRQEVIPTNDGLTWVNDTTATTPTALLTAIKALPERSVLISGGTTKQLPLGPELLEELRARQAEIIWLSGSGTKELFATLGIPASQPTYDSMAEAVEAARILAQEKKINRIVLSPGFSSFEHFLNEFDRGDQFNASIRPGQ